MDNHNDTTHYFDDDYNTDNFDQSPSSRKVEPKFVSEFAKTLSGSGDPWADYVFGYKTEEQAYDEESILASERAQFTQDQERAKKNSLKEAENSNRHFYNDEDNDYDDIKNELEQRMMREIEQKKRNNHINSIIPRENEDRANYYKQTETKHFGDVSQPGSKFTDPTIKNLNQLVYKAWEQRGTLKGNDIDKFIARGADPSSFKSGNRYLFVETTGTVGIKNSMTLSDDALVQVVRTKEGVPCSLVYNVTEQETTDYAVIVITKDNEDPEGKKDLLITAFPGMPTLSQKNPAIDAMEGQFITMGEARKLVGDVWLNTRLIK